MLQKLLTGLLVATSLCTLTQTTLVMATEISSLKAEYTAETTSQGLPLSGLKEGDYVQGMSITKVEDNEYYEKLTFSGRKLITGTYTYMSAEESAFGVEMYFFELTPYSQKKLPPAPMTEILKSVALACPTITDGDCKKLFGTKEKKMTLVITQLQTTNCTECDMASPEVSVHRVAKTY